MMEICFHGEAVSIGMVMAIELSKIWATCQDRMRASD